MTSTIDCRAASAQRPRSTGLKRALQVGALGLGGLFALAMVGAVIRPPPSGVLGKPAAPSKPNSMPAAASSTSTSAPSSPPTTSNAEPDVQAGGGLDYLFLKAEAEEKLRGVLTDDHGVRYRDVRTKLSTLEGGGIVAFCGEENSRTPLDGYGGFQRFVASRSVAVTESQMEPADFSQAWTQFCENAVEGPQVWF